MNSKEHLTEDEVIREVAEEEGMSYEEVKEIWSTFKDEAKNAMVAKRKATKPKRDKGKVKAKRKTAKQTRKKNR